MESIIIAIALANGVDPNLVLAISYKESHMQYVVNTDDGGSPSYGPLQVKEVAKRQVASEGDLNDIVDSTTIGVLYLKYNLKRCRGLVGGINGFNRGKCFNKPTTYTNDVLRYYNYFRIKNMYNNLY